MFSKIKNKHRKFLLNCRRQLRDISEDLFLDDYCIRRHGFSLVKTHVDPSLSGSFWRSRPPSPRGGFATLKPRWSLSQTKPGRLQSASRSVGPAGAAAQRARLHRQHSCRERVAHGVCPNVQPSRSRAKQALHSRTFRRAAAVQRKGEPGPITYCQPQKPTARLELGSRRPLASVGKESHQSRGRPRKRGLPRPVRHPSPVPRATTGFLWLGPRARLRLMAGAGSRQIR